MTGIDLEQLGKSEPAIALAAAIVKFGNQVASLLRSFRAEKKLSQMQMAELLGVSQPRIAQLESGKPGNAPSLEQLAEYAFHAGKAVTVCDSSQLAAREEQLASMEEKNKALAREIHDCDAKLHKQREQLREQQDRIRSLENAMGRLMVLGHTTRELRAKHLASRHRGIGIRLKEIGDRLFAAVLMPSFEDDFSRQYLSRPEMEELAKSFQTFLHKERTRVDIVLNTVSDALQRHASS
jgi:transcriptional regulator with XRE-family HTH domain